MYALVPIPDFSTWPIAVSIAADRVQFAFRQFFAAEIRNPHTRYAYLKGAEDFFAFVASRDGGNALHTIDSLHVTAWIDDMAARRLSAPTIKQRLAGLRMLFRALVRERILAINPADVVRGPKHSVTTGKTPVLSGDEVKQLLQSITATTEFETLTALRDRAMIATMAYTFARVTAVTSLRVVHVFTQHRKLWLRLHDKGGKNHDIPCHHALESYLADWLDAAGHKHQSDAPLFQTIVWELVSEPMTTVHDGADGLRLQRKKPLRRRVLSGRPMTQSLAWDVVQRRTKAAGIDTKVCNHTFRAAGITAYLSHGGTIERAAKIAGHVSTRTTQLYDRRSDDVTMDEINKIQFE
jgi:site-specific recombinase XerD